MNEIKPSIESAFQKITDGIDELQAAVCDQLNIAFKPHPLTKDPLTQENETNPNTPLSLIHI